MTAPPFTYLDRETSWLGFAGRVLQEADDPSVPLFERLFFCAIFSSNLDEYFRVRVASLRTLLRLGKAHEAKLGIDAHRLLHDIHRIVVEQQARYGAILDDVFSALDAAGIRRVTNEAVDARHHDFLRSTFVERVRPFIRCMPLGRNEGEPPFLENNAIYLVVEMWSKEHRAYESWVPDYVLIEVPTSSVGRFVTLPHDGDAREVMFLDDLIRYNLGELFPDREVGRCYAVKLTRDAELYVEDDFEGDLVAAIKKSLKKRQTGLPSRCLYDMRMPFVLLHRLQERLGLQEEDMVLGARYHNLSDYMAFPRFGRDDLAYPKWPPLPHPVLDEAPSVIEAVERSDQVVHTPYQSFDPVIRFLAEAARDPAVEEIWLTVYRVARDSGVLNALLAAAKSGKRVTVFIEVQARFDEESNLVWAERLQEAGVHIIYSMQGLKVHAKIALVVRRGDGARELFAYAGTGNFNEKTARVYTDHGLFTCDPRITSDIEQVFHFLAGEIEKPEPAHVLVAPFTLRSGVDDLIAHEAARAAAGRPSGITVKLNSLEDEKMIERLYEASRAGVPIDVIVRGICRLIPGVPGQSETIRVRSILDRYLEHGRIYRFHHDGEERMYIASADWMKRNLSHRVEVAVPVYDDEVRRQLEQALTLQLADNRKARIIDAACTNRYARAEGAPPVRSQEAFRDFVASLQEARLTAV